MLQSATRHTAVMLLLVLLAALGGGCGSQHGDTLVRTDTTDPASITPGGGTVLLDNYFSLATEGSGGRVVRWTRSTIPVWIDTTNTPENWREDHVALLQEAMETWASGSGGRISFTVIPQPVDPCVQVRWVKVDPMGMADAGAVTQLQTATGDGGMYFTGVRMEIRTTDPRGRPEPDRMMRTFSAHELGHAIGIWGHSDSTNDVMYPSAGYVEMPSQRDFNTLARIYAAAPQITEGSGSSRVRGEPFITMP